MIKEHVHFKKSLRITLYPLMIPLGNVGDCQDATTVVLPSITRLTLVGTPGTKQKTKQKTSSKNYPQLFT